MSEVRKENTEMVMMVNKNVMFVQKMLFVLHRVCVGQGIRLAGGLGI